MYFNMFLEQFNLDPSEFEDLPVEPTECEGEKVYYIRQRLKSRICDKCACKDSLVIHDYRLRKLAVSESPDNKTTIMVYRLRVRCKECGKVYTIPLHNVHSYARRTSLLEKEMANACKETTSFASIARRFGVSINTVIKFFNMHNLQVKRNPLPEKLCIDEIYYPMQNTNFLTVLYDYETGDIVDLIPSRDDAQLDKYFMNIREGERKNVKVFISDMYKGFARAKEQWFPKAIHCVDYFHALKQLKDVIGRLRYRVQTIHATSDPNLSDFMKRHAKLFEKNEHVLKDQTITLLDGTVGHTLDLITQCLKLDQHFWDAYRIFQELIQYSKYNSYEDSANFIQRISKKLLLEDLDLLQKVGETYARWQAPIAQGMIARKGGKRYHNGKAEGNNSFIRRVINVSYCYRNFETMRKRVLLIKRENKKVE